MPKTIFLSVLFAFLGTLSFAILLNIERRKALFASLGGGISWLIYECVLLALHSPAVAIFLASLGAGLYSEIMARRMKTAATIFYIPGFIPLVPGSNIYYSVLAAVRGEQSEAITQFLNTIIFSAAITLGLIIASALMSIYWNVRRISIKKLIQEIRKR
ncbi:hypothetical protein ABB02_01382 [Clostridiaceae bacterium JG1575]|nr:hypothetical protein ABB02_01382 [Clostridiaceae bacterium JG1575]